MLSEADATTSRADIRFPSVCPRCSRAATTTYDMAAHRDIELFVLSYYRFVIFPIPVCGACKRRRALAGFGGITIGIAAILICGFITLTALLNESRTAATVSGLAVVVLTLYVRFRAETDLNWHALGLRIRWLSGDNLPLAVRMRRPEYFRAWMAVNPHAQVVTERPAAPDC